MQRTIGFAIIVFALAACGDAASGSTNNSSPNGNSQTGNAQTGNSVPGDLIETERETWEWVAFPDSKCANGQPTGIGVNQTDRSDDLMVFFQGGGACWDVNTCFVLNSAVNIESGYTGARFENEPVRGASAFDRDNPDNPFRDLNWVFVPYCTGDLHAGDNVKRYTALGQTRDLHHVGAINVEEFLARLGPTFGDANRVFVTGSSAGGYGAQLNLHRFDQAFPDAELHLLSDSGPLVQPFGGRYAEWNAAWSLQAPAGCEGCTASADGMSHWFDYLVDAYPEVRFALLSYDADQVIHLFFGYPIGDSFANALRTMLDEQYAPAPNAEAFVLPGTQHVLLGGLTQIQAGDETSLSDWVQAWMDGEGWQTVRP
jgi:hypothetical protein